MRRPPPLQPPPPPELKHLLREFLSVFRYGRRALQLVWETRPTLALALGLLTVLGGVLPTAAAWIGARIIDTVIVAQASGGDVRDALRWVILEGVVIALLALCSRSLAFTHSLLRAQLGHRVNVLILEKAQQLELAQFEDSEFYDRLIRARREASTRPLSLVSRSFGLLQNLVALSSFAVLLFQYSGWAVFLLLAAGLPGFVAETKFSGDAFRLFRWRSAEKRMQDYLESVLARDDHAKEVKLFGLGPRLLVRYKDIFQRLYSEDRKLALKRDIWGFALGLMATVILYGAYGWVVVAAVAGRITVGQMTLYLLLLRQGQTAVTAALGAVSGLYEDNLYLSTLYEYLETPLHPVGGTETQGPLPGDGIRFEDVCFSYPGAREAAVDHVTLHLQPGHSLALVGANGSGKTTLVKLLTRLYLPDSGRVLLDGLDLRQWDEATLRARIGVIFQDFTRYQMPVGENIGAGDEPNFEDEALWREAAQKGRAEDFIAQLPDGYHTQLGKWFLNGRELSGGQWQKVALSRAFMRSRADILVLDEPTAAMDAQAEAEVFDHFRQLAQRRATILISHRFSTVRHADQIAVLERGRLLELGSHEQLMQTGGRYAELFQLQARGYR
ncbi:MAG: ABC transporter ATP-binding protein [Proteobacteria bacterium]|nr:ABC transporter ATP-binding protein [Pseudomonadota bacterium]